MPEEYQAIAVGKPYPKEAILPEDGTEFNFKQGSYELKLCYTNPSEKEIEAIRTGRPHFSLFKEGNILFLLFKFGNNPWSDAPYHFSQLPENMRSQPEDISEGMGIALSVILY
jgi:hypothetical protein